MNISEKINSGSFSTWLKSTREAQISNESVDVPCGECFGCCKSSYFIHIKPEEKETRARIPKELQFPAPGLPKGHVILPYDQNGCCPMLVNDKCSIYENRPQTCRTYDCRIFPATNLKAGGKDKSLINQQIERWQFEFQHETDKNEFEAVRKAAAFLQKHAKKFPVDFIPGNPTQIAVLAIKVYRVFLNAKGNEIPNPEFINLIVDEFKNFEDKLQKNK